MYSKSVFLIGFKVILHALNGAALLVFFHYIILNDVALVTLYPFDPGFIAHSLGLFISRHQGPDQFLKESRDLACKGGLELFPRHFEPGRILPTIPLDPKPKYYKTSFTTTLTPLS